MNDVAAIAITLTLASLAVGLASYSVTMLVRYTDGPLDMFFRFRVYAGLVYKPLYDEDDNIVDIIEETPETQFRLNEDGDVIGTANSDVMASLVACYWCLTSWVSLLISMFVCILLLNALLYTPIVWLAAIGISGFLYTYGSSK